MILNSLADEHMSLIGGIAIALSIEIEIHDRRHQRSSRTVPDFLGWLVKRERVEKDAKQGGA
jgi:hypothetical protein